MPPIPDQNNAELYGKTGLKGKEFRRMIDVVDSLMQTPTTLVVPPNETVTVEGIPFPMKDSYLISGGTLTDHVEFMYRSGIVPKTLYDAQHSDALSHIFGVSINIDEHAQHVIVSRKNYAVKLQHDGLQNPLTDFMRNAIFGLSILDASLWPKVVNNGFVFGQLTGSYWEPNWNAENMCIFLHDPDAKLGWRNSDDKVLEEFSIQALNRSLNDNKQQRREAAQQYLQQLAPVGLFIDLRHTPYESSSI